MGIRPRVDGKWEEFVERLDALAEDIRKAQKEEPEVEDVKEVFVKPRQIWRIGDGEHLCLIAPTMRIQRVNGQEILYSIIQLNGYPWHYLTMNTSLEHIQIELDSIGANYVAPSFEKYLEYATRED